jgi:hypothetical protein
MPSADLKSLSDWARAYARLATLAVALPGLVLSGAASAAEPPVVLEYSSAIAGYRTFDAYAPSVDWREANDAIRDGAEGGAHGMHDMRAPMELPPTTGDTPPPATPGEATERRP